MQRERDGKGGSNIENFGVCMGYLPSILTRLWAALPRVLLSRGGSGSEQLLPYYHKSFCFGLCGHLS